MKSIGFAAVLGFGVASQNFGENSVTNSLPKSPLSAPPSLVIVTQKVGRPLAMTSTGAPPLVFVTSSQYPVFARGTNAGPSLLLGKGGTNLLPYSPSGNLRPGVYETAPYSGIVIVPERHPDEGALRNATTNQGNFALKVIKPELRFIPRGDK